MRIRIKSTTTSSESNILMVEFSCMSGLGKGRWATWAPPPHVGLSYDVELDIDDPVILGETAAKSTPGTPSISTMDDRTTLLVAIEGKDDELLYARLAPDCVLMLESDEEIGIGDYITVTASAKNVQISPFGYPQHKPH